MPNEPNESNRDDPSASRPQKRKRGLMPGLIVGFLFLVLTCGGLGVFGYMRVMESLDRTASHNSMLQISYAFRNYQSNNGGFPANSYDANGRPLLSWRVHILPYLEEDVLYRQFRLDEPWDGPNNIHLLSQMPKIYGTSSERNGSTRGTKTFYRGFSSAGAVFDPALVKHKEYGTKKEFGTDALRLPTGLGAGKWTDNSSDTILLVEAGEAVEWTKPEDLDASPGKPFPPLGGVRPGASDVNVAFLDGTIRSIKKSTPEAVWRAAVTHSGGESVNFE